MKKKIIKLLFICLLYGLFVLINNNTVYASVQFDGKTCTTIADTADKLDKASDYEWFFNPSWDDLKNQMFDSYQTHESKHSSCWHVTSVDEYMYGNGGTSRTIGFLIDIDGGKLTVNGTEITSVNKDDVKGMIIAYLHWYSTYGESTMKTVNNGAVNSLMSAFKLYLNSALDEEYATNGSKIMSLLCPKPRDTSYYKNTDNYGVTDDNYTGYRIRFIYACANQISGEYGQPYLISAYDENATPQTGSLKIIKKDENNDEMISGAKFYVYCNEEESKGYVKVSEYNSGDTSVNGKVEYVSKESDATEFTVNKTITINNLYPRKLYSH